MTILTLSPSLLCTAAMVPAVAALLITQPFLVPSDHLAVFVTDSFGGIAGSAPLRGSFFFLIMPTNPHVPTGSLGALCLGCDLPQAIWWVVEGEEVDLTEWGEVKTRSKKEEEKKVDRF